MCRELRNNFSGEQKKKNVFKENIPQSGGKNDKKLRWDRRLQIQNLFIAFKRVPQW